MRRPWLPFVVVALMATPALAQTFEERVRENASLWYIHGINQELAEQQIGFEGVPILLELLQDPDFDRRDNVVAFLGYLADDEVTAKLLDYYGDPPAAIETAEERRAMLLVPDALGNMAKRGGVQALSALQGLKRDRKTLADPGIARMVDYGIQIAGRVSEEEEDEPEAPPAAPTDIDPDPFADVIPLDFANHVDTNSKISDARVDSILLIASTFMATENAATDTACCVGLEREGNALLFGTEGDGQDVITAGSTLSSVLSNPIARVKVVDLIQWCSGPGSNILGCAPVGGFGMVVVRVTNPSSEGVVWAHELGHNTGLSHNPVGLHIMTSFVGANHNRLSGAECATYHDPDVDAQVNVIGVGPCGDSDGDGIVAPGDNCPSDNNPDQADGDGDGVGNECDNCTFDSNPDQADCDSNGIGNVCDPFTSAPDEVLGVGFIDKSTFSWPFTGVDKQVLRGQGTVGLPFPDNLSLIGNLPSFFDQWTDASVPAAGDYYFYQVRGFNGCGVGP